VSTGAQRPQLVPGPGKRVVLVIPRMIPTDPALPEDRRLMATLDQIQRGGWHLVAIIEPEHYLDALQLVLDGMADVVVVTKPEHFPVIRLASELNGPGVGREARTRPLPRPYRPTTPASDHPGREGAERRRPRLIGPDDTEEPSERRTEPVDRRPAVVRSQERTQVIRRTA
jgi:hypothetical protein